MKTAARSLAFALLFTSFLHAQKHELAFTGGGDFVSTFHTTGALEACYARRLIHVPMVGLYGELPLGIGLQNGTSLGTARYSSVFFTPGLKVKFTPPLGVAPYFLVGGGVAHFNGSGGAASSTSGAVDFGGGVDLNLAPLLGVRAEVRDYYSGTAKLVTSASGRQHNVFVTAGIVLRF